MGLQRKTFFYSYRLGLNDLFLTTCSHYNNCEYGPLSIFGGLVGIFECSPQHVLDLENDKFNSLEATDKNVLEAKALAGLNDKAHVELIV
jgi:hypothetical protein